MKKLLCALLAVTMLLAMAGTALAQDYDLVVYTARVEGLNKIVIEGFEKATGLKVETITGGSGEVLKRAVADAESGNVYADILWSADATMLSANKDLFQVYVSSENDKMMKPFQNDGSNVFTAAIAEPNVIIVNTDMLKELGVEVNGYADLLQPELKGKIISGDPANSSSAFQCLIGMLYGMGKDNDPMSQEAWDFLDQFLKNLEGKQANSSSQIYKGVAQGEYAVGLSFEDPCVALQAAGEYPVKVVYPVEGLIFPGESVQILKDAPHLENAQKFVDFLLSEATMNEIGMNLNLRPLREGATLNENMVPNDQLKLFDNYDENWVAEHKAEIISMYTDHLESSME